MSSTTTVHEVWPVSSTTTLTSSGCEQMVTGPIHIDGGIFDFGLTSVHVLV